MKTAFKRRSVRKKTYPLKINKILLINENNLLAKLASFVELSEHGFKILIHRNHVVDPFRSQLNWNSLIGKHILLHIDELDLILEGQIKRIKIAGKGCFELGIDYTQSAPDYWRECFFELVSSDHFDHT